MLERPALRFIMLITGANHDLALVLAAVVQETERSKS
jgi:hypothetical protein